MRRRFYGRDAGLTENMLILSMLRRFELTDNQLTYALGRYCSVYSSKYYYASLTLEQLGNNNSTKPQHSIKMSSSEEETRNESQKYHRSGVIIWRP
jgi:hypothetical protein